MVLHFSPPSAASGHVKLPLNPPPHNLPPSFPTREQLMVLFCCPTSWSRSPSRQRIRNPHRWPELHVAHDGPVHSWERQEECSGVEYNVPFREESCRSSCIYSGPLHSYNCDDVSQHPSTRAAAESNQLIYSGHALQALSDLARQFQCHPIFGREINLYAGKCHFTGKSIGDQPRSFANLDLLLFVQSTRVIDKAKVLCTFIIQLLEIYILITSWSWYILGSGVELN